MGRTWNPVLGTDTNHYYVAIANYCPEKRPEFNSSVDLPIYWGDIIRVQFECADWFCGYKMKEQSVQGPGTFPKSFVKRYADQEDRPMEELTKMASREWTSSQKELLTGSRLTRNKAGELLSKDR